MKVSGLFGIGDHLSRLSETGDSLEMLAKIIAFEAFRPVLDAGLGYSDGSRLVETRVRPGDDVQGAELAAQKDTDARWTVKIGRPRDPDAERSVPELAIAVFGYKTHVAVDRAFGFIRSWAVTSAARHDGAVLREIVTTNNTASGVWADTAYRSRINEEWLRARGLVSRIHRKKPPRRPMPEHVRRGNASRSQVRSAVEHVFAQQKDRMGLFIRTVGIERAKAKIGLANIAYNMGRLIFHERRLATG